MIIHVVLYYYLSFFILTRLSIKTPAYTRLESERWELDRTTYRLLGHENRFPAFFLSFFLFFFARTRNDVLSFFFSFLDSMVCVCAQHVDGNRVEEIHLSSSAFFSAFRRRKKEQEGPKRGKNEGKS